VKRKRVLVLGCGPAGLFAAQAAQFMGYDVDIISIRRKSEMFGAQYLHSDIPGLTDDQTGFTVEYRLTGELDDYLHKVYGETIPDRSAITRKSLVGVYPAWDIRRAYDSAWRQWFQFIQAPPGDTKLDALALTDLILPPFGNPRRWKLVISTIPARDICFKPNQHTFAVRDVWAVGDAPERGIFAPWNGEDNVIEYDGTPDRGWYRASRIAGYSAVEWPENHKPPIPEVAKVSKPVKTNCDCWDSKNFLRLGRYGAWHRSGHTHQAYWKTLEVLGWR
jgi:hypothetical protein